MNSIDEDEYKKFEMKLARVVTCAIRQSKGNELKDAISDILSYFSETLDTLRKGEQCVVSLYEALSSQEWIPVSERLPEPYTRVLACIESGYMEVDYMYSEPIVDVGIADFNSLDNVTHWMPLPKFPEVQE